ncbi:MAG: hypothetical protein M3N54_15485 [Acidobacteriota bacterium]|nr:hypothetical protein [Acidobacteriota bacterium]
MARLIAAKDWAAAPLGPIESGARVCALPSASAVPVLALDGSVEAVAGSTRYTTATSRV